LCPNRISVKNSETNISPAAADAGRRIAPEVEAGYAALTRGAGVRLCPERVVIRMTGDDRVSFLQGMCSNDIKRLAPDGLVMALFLTERAHLIADAVVWAAPDSLLIETDRALWPAAREQLERFLVADDVEMEELDDQTVIHVDGPLGAELAAAVFGEPVAEIATWRHIEAAGGVRVACVTRWGARAFTMIAGSGGASDVVARLLAAGTGREVRQVVPQACEIVRVESGTARVGADTDARTLALEARMEPAISSDKGCYVGQETVERATARGALKRRLMGLRFGGESGGRILESGAQVILDGKEIGRLTSPVRSPRLGTIGLAILHHSAWTPGAAVLLRDASGEVSATVSELPFATD
jgi:folate-binding protein YgfZ